MTETEILEAAKKLCDNHLYIFPVKRDKTPATPKGFKDATNNFNEFLKFYKEGYGIGLLTGKLNNLYIVDLDVEKDENHKPIIKDDHTINTGTENFSKKFSLDKNGDKYKTHTVRTQSGGSQLYYKLRRGQQPLKTHLVALPKVDFKADDGYVVVPPSEGIYGKYEIIIDIPVAYMPDGLYNYWHGLDNPVAPSSVPFKIENVKPLKMNDDLMAKIIDTSALILKYPHGKGNEDLLDIAGALAIRGVDLKTTKLIMQQAAAQNNWHDVNYSAIDDTFRRISLRESAELTEEDKVKLRTKGYTSLLEDLKEHESAYPKELYARIISNLHDIFEATESTFYDVDSHNVKHFNKSKSIKFVMSKYPFLYTDDFENLHYFSVHDGWHDDIENSLKNFIQTTDDSLSEHNINEIILGIKHITYNKEFKNNPLPNEFIPLESGIYNINTHALESHNNYYFYSNIKRNYIPGVKEESLALSRFLDKVLTNPERDKLTIFESIAWALLNDNNIQGMLIFFGEGGNGKGIIQKYVIQRLLGNENVAMPDLSRIANYPFELANLIGKKAILFSESIKGVTYNWEILKRITGHDYENIPIKNKAAAQWEYKSSVFLSTNSLIPPKDELAIWRRVLNIVEFSNYLNGLSSAEISDITDKLSDPMELDKLFSFIIDNISPKFIRHGFTYRYDIKTTKEKYLMKSNPAITYLKLKESRDEILTDSEDVLEYCKNNNYDQNICYYQDKNGNETIFQIKENLLKQVNAFCSVNHLPRYDIHDRNSQTKIGQAMHYLDLDAINFDKRLNGKKIKAWSGIFVTPDGNELKIEDKETANDDINREEGPQLQHLYKFREDMEKAGVPIDWIDNKIKEYKATHPGNTGNSTIDNTGTQNPGNSDIDTLPDGPVKQSLIQEREEQEHNAKKKPVKKSIHYYQLNANFDKYEYDFFKGSDIELQSSRTFYYKDSTKIKYMLYQLLMPEEPENTPDGWFSFSRKDGRELESEKAYNALSKGDLQ